MTSDLSTAVIFFSRVVRDSEEFTVEEEEEEEEDAEEVFGRLEA